MYTRKNKCWGGGTFHPRMRFILCGVSVGDQNEVRECKRSWAPPRLSQDHQITFVTYIDIPILFRVYDTIQRFLDASWYFAQVSGQHSTSLWHYGSGLLTRWPPSPFDGFLCTLVASITSWSNPLLHPWFTPWSKTSSWQLGWQLEVPRMAWEWQPIVGMAFLALIPPFPRIIPCLFMPSFSPHSICSHHLPIVPSLFNHCPKVSPQKNSIPWFSHHIP